MLTEQDEDGSTTIRFNGGKLVLSASLVKESRVLESIMDSETTDFCMNSIQTTQETLDIVKRLLLGESVETNTIPEDQWRGIAEIADLLDIERLHKIVIQHYKLWCLKDTQWLKGWYCGEAGMHERVDVTLAKRVLCGSINDGKDVLELAESGNEWKNTSLGGHCGAVYALAVLPDGRLASGSEDCSIRLWNVDTGECTKTLSGHMYNVNALVVLPDGRLASGSSDESIKLWDTESISGMCHATLQGHTRDVTCLAVLPDGRLASGSLDTRIKLWDTVTNECTGELYKYCGICFEVWSLAVLHDGRLASGFADGSIKVWDTNTLSRTATLTIPFRPGYIWCLKVLPDGQLAAGYFDGFVRIWDTVTEACTAEFSVDTRYVCALQSLPDGRLACSSSHMSLKIWNTISGTCVVTAQLSDYENFVVRSLAILADGRLVCGYDCGSIKLYDSTTGTQETLVLGQPGRISATAVLNDGRIAVSYSRRCIWAWNHITGGHEEILAGVGYEVNALAGLPDGRLAVGVYNGDIKLWDIVNNTCTFLGRHASTLTALTMMPCGVILASASASATTIALWDTTNCTLVRLLECESTVQKIVAFPDGYLAALNDRCALYVWTAKTYSNARSRIGSNNPALFSKLPMWSNNLSELTKGFKAAVQVNVKNWGCLPGGRIVKVLYSGDCYVDDVLIACIPNMRDVLKTRDGCLVLCGSYISFVTDVSCRANVFLALTAARVPLVYVMQVLSE